MNLEQRVAGVLSGQRRDIAWAMSEVEDGTDAGQAVLNAIRPNVGRAHVVGITGPGGAGKSTLVSALIRELRAGGQTIGVVAVDPSSPVSGGALLGDRIRMNEHVAADEVFIRSVASRGHQGGLSLTAGRLADIFDASGMSTVIVETLGAGQAEIDICEVADTRVVVCPPGLGDEVQAMKAGMLEMADVLVVNKADLPQAERLHQSLLGMLSLRPAAAWQVPVILTVATSGEGIAALADTIARHAREVGRDRRRGAVSRLRGMLLQLAAAECRQRILGEDDAAMNDLCAAFETARIGQSEALAEVFALLSRRLSAGC
jgi:LAO/AO transport system kinase